MESRLLEPEGRPWSCPSPGRAAGPSPSRGGASALEARKTSKEGLLGRSLTFRRPTLAQYLHFWREQSGDTRQPLRRGARAPAVAEAATRSRARAGQ
jgi:hypothetical protein